VRGPRSPRLLATDLDGTLVRSDGTVSGRSRRALELAERCGVLVVIVTGRPPRWLAPVVEQTGHRGLAVCANGAVLYDLHRERVVRSSLLEVAAAQEVVRCLREQIPGLAFAAERSGLPDDRFLHEATYTVRWPQPLTVESQLAEVLAEPMVKLLARHPDLGADDLLARARVAVGSSATLTHSSTDGLLEISAAGVSKASGLAALADERGIDAADVVAFGDMPNDLPMLAWAGHSVAVANAHPDVLEAVDEVTADHNDDGVAQVIERLLGSS